jgi:uncharacterized membrane protein (UPF0127 family)
MSKKIVLFLCLLLLSVSCGKQNKPIDVVPSPLYNYNHKLQVGGQILMVEIAVTPSQMQDGLSNRVSMDENQGMLFDFGSRPSEPAFWMKDMKFNLDFIWIAGGKVVGITPNVNLPNSPSVPLPDYSPPQPINQVLEVNAGWAKKNNIVVGDNIIFQ